MDDDDELLSDTIEELVKRIDKYEIISAKHNANGKVVLPYKIRGNLVGGIQTCLMRGYLKRLKYNKNCWRKDKDSMNDIDLIDRMMKAKVRTWYWDCIVCKIDPRPNQTEVGWEAQRTEYINNV
jgi:hypothetical protein